MWGKMYRINAKTGAKRLHQIFCHESHKLYKFSVLVREIRGRNPKLRDSRYKIKKAVLLRLTGRHFKEEAVE